MYTLSKYDTGKVSFIYDRNMKFQMGFESISQIRHVQYNMNPVRYNLRLKLSGEREKKKEIKEIKDKEKSDPLDLEIPRYKPTIVSLSNYAELGKEVMIDTAAILSIDKKNKKQLTYQKMLAQELTYMIQLETLSVQEFVTLPVISSINIVLPKSIREETDDFISFDSIAIYSKPESIDEMKMKIMQTYKNVYE